jgi:L-2-hydroxyglutarate oxidase
VSGGHGGREALRQRARNPVQAVRKARGCARRARTAAACRAQAARGRERPQGLSEVDTEEIRELEPNAAGIRALHVPETGIIDFHRVALAYADEVRARGADILLGSRVVALERGTAVGNSSSRAAVPSRPRTSSPARGCTRIASPHSPAATAPRSGSSPFGATTTRSSPRPDPSSTGSSIRSPTRPSHFWASTSRSESTAQSGRGRTPCLPSREGYRRWQLNPRDLASTVGFPGFRRLAREYARTGAAEAWRDFVKWAFVRELRRYVPRIRSRDLMFGPSGTRAQCMSADGKLVEDFLLEEGDGVLHVLNAPSPGATASWRSGGCSPRRRPRPSRSDRPNTPIWIIGTTGCPPTSGLLEGLRS